MRVAGVAIAALVVGRDLAFGARGESWVERLVPAAGAVVLLLLLARGDPAAVGLRLRPAPSWRWWLRVLLWLAAGFAAFMAVLYAVALVWDVGIPPIHGTAAGLRRWAWQACLLAPLVEETIYRLVLATPLVPWIGRRPTILVSGVVFALLHWRYGNPGPDNHAAGFVLAWVYLRSGCIWLPMALHAFGNLFVFLVHLGLLEGWLRLPGLRLA